MARQNREDVFDPHEVSVMHCINRAVRRAMLCGLDPVTGKSFEHRRDWVKERLVFLAAHYGIDVLGYAILGNHLHVILRNRPDVVQEWSDKEVARRIWNLFPKRKDPVTKAPLPPEDHELKMLMASKKVLAEYRRRLSDVSWMMRQLAEKIARDANREDLCTGRFWEGRFKSQPLLDDAAILACAAYVDLNPIRAGIAETPEASDFTSVQDRIEAAKEERKAKKTSSRKPSSKRQSKQRASGRRDEWLSPVYLDERGATGPCRSKSGSRASDKGFLPVPLLAYLKLVDWTGRQIKDGKRGRIPATCKPILERLGLDGEVWCDLVKDFGRLFKRVAGRPESMASSAESSGLAQRRSAGGVAMLAAS